MRTFFTYLVLILHINTTMFFPVAEESVAFDMKGRPVDDVTSIVEFVDQVLLEHQDQTPRDKEEDHREHFFNAFKCGLYITTQKIVYAQQPVFEIASTAQYSELEENSFPIVSYDILTPPPKA